MNPNPTPSPGADSQEAYAEKMKQAARAAGAVLGPGSTVILVTPWREKDGGGPVSAAMQTNGNPDLVVYLLSNCVTGILSGALEKGLLHYGVSVVGEADAKGSAHDTNNPLQPPSMPHAPPPPAMPRTDWNPPSTSNPKLN